MGGGGGIKCGESVCKVSVLCHELLRYTYSRSYAINITQKGKEANHHTLEMGSKVSLVELKGEGGGDFVPCQFKDWCVCVCARVDHII